MREALQTLLDNQLMTTCKSPDKSQLRTMAARSLTAIMLFGVMSLQPNVAMAEVFKCKVGNSTVYQGLPCDGKMVENSGTAANASTPTVPPVGNALAKPAAVVSPGNAVAQARATLPVSPPANLGRMTLAQLYAAIVKANSEMQGLSAEHDKNVKALSPTDTAGLERAHNTYHSRLEANDRLRKELTNELRRRCPGGANLSTRSQQCKQ